MTGFRAVKIELGFMQMDLEYIEKHFNTIVRILEAGGVPQKESLSPEELKSFLEQDESPIGYLEGLVDAVRTKNDEYLNHFKRLLDR